jgi:hypothetical protein
MFGKISIAQLRLRRAYNFEKRTRNNAFFVFRIDKEEREYIEREIGEHGYK